MSDPKLEQLADQEQQIETKDVSSAIKPTASPLRRRSTPAQMQGLARVVRKHIALGHSRQETCEIEGITRDQYRAALRFIGRKAWSSNQEAFSNLRIGVTARLEGINERIQALLDSPATEVAKAREYATLCRLALDAYRSIFDMGLKLGILQRETLKLDEKREVIVRFGDEDTIPFFAQDGFNKQLPPAEDDEAESK